KQWHQFTIARSLQQCLKKPAFPKEIRFDSPEQLLKQKRSLTLFRQSQSAMLKLQQNIKLDIKGGMKF
ncbi:hypothetical protein ACZ87_03539, partial [Candidatus Erwinia dacicola]